MGVPKFFRYISERYPCLSELVKETQIPEFDNLYLDMNGIIHNCSHPDDDNVHFRITEEQIFTDIFHYIDTLFRMIQPRKLFFMAVDGVAPRAKMNQQRGRRFRSAKEAETKENLARQKGETLPDTVRFDSNCITPGTAFMVRLQDGLKRFIQTKISTNPLWRNCRVILSGHETPGEGEHKIMEYIRYLKATPDFNPNTRHCLYGLDADLVMLGLCSHELHFSLLREEVKFGSKAKKSASVDCTRFFLLHLGLMREYLELEFVDVKAKLPFAYDMDAIVDDWILMCYLVGNDFIPNLPNFHINTNALPTLYTAYKKVLPQLGGYINEGGVLNLRRLEVFLGELGEVDRAMFKQKNGNLECLRVDNEETFGEFALDVSGLGEEEDGDGELNANEDLRRLAQNTLDMYLGDEENEDEATVEQREFFVHKRDYYMKKMGYAEMTPEVLAEQAECYVRALQWTLFYYYRGVKSWCWYYPHHYAPYISDVRNFAHLRFDYEEGTPFLPFQQLLAVLPAASREHLPIAYHGLMTSEQSRVIDYYPPNFDTDLNGKKQDWEAVVLIPFIDERRLLEAMAECEGMLTPDEVERNTHGPMYQYDYSEHDQGALPERADGVGGLLRTYCVETAVQRSELHVAEDKLVLGTSPGVLRDVYFAGFPTFKHKPYNGAVKSVRARVFDMRSSQPSMLVKLQPDVVTADNSIEADVDADTNDETSDGFEVGVAIGLQQLQAHARDLIGAEVFVGWPHITEAKVVAVCDRDYECNAPNEQPQANDARRFETQVKSLANHYKERMAIDIGRTSVLVCARPLRERKYEFGEQGRMRLTKVWSDVRVYYALQTIVRDLRIHRDPRNAEQTHVRDVFPVGCTVFMASNNLYYGARGVVNDVEAVERTGRIGIELYDAPAPDFAAAQRLESTTSTRFVQAHQAAASIGLYNAIFSQITGTLLVTLGAERFPLPDNTPRVNIGLQLKFPKRSEELAGYSKRVGNSFVYTQRAIDLVAAYAARWPEVMQAVRRRGGNDAFFETDLFVGGSRENLNTLQAWLKAQPHAQAERRACGARTLEDDTVTEVLAAVKRVSGAQAEKTVRLKVLPSCLYKPGLGDEKTAPDAAAKYELFDRVVVVKETHTVPLGYRGTVVGIQSVVDPNPVRQENQRRAEMFYDVLFDEPYTVVAGVEKRMFKMSPLHLLNITFGSAKFTQRTGQPTGTQRKVPAVAASKAMPMAPASVDLSVQSSADIWAMMKRAPQPAADGTPAQQQQMPILWRREQPQPAQSDQKQQPQQQGRKPQHQQQKPPQVQQQTQQQLENKHSEKAAFEQLMQQMKMSASHASANANASTTASTTTSNNTIEQYQPINLEDMFRVDTTNLPKPPVNWRNKLAAQLQPKTNGVAGAMHAAGSGPQQSLHRPHVYHPQQKNFALPPFQLPPPPFIPPPQQQQRPYLLQQQQPHYQEPPVFFQHPAAHAAPQQHGNHVHAGFAHSGMNVPRKGPQGPQTLRQNGMYPDGQGAFIPLQATRKQAAAAAAAASHRKITSAAGGGASKSSGTVQRRNDASKHNDEVAAPTPTDTTANREQTTRPRFIGHAPKPSRIAARFDVKP